MTSAPGKVLVLAQTARAARGMAERLTGRRRPDHDIVVVLRSREDIPQCCVRAWDDYVPEGTRAREVGRVRAALDSAAERLHDAFTAHGLFVYPAWRPEFFSFFLDDLVALACVVRESWRKEQPSEVHVAEDPWTRSWWTGRERLADVAGALAGAESVQVRARPGRTLRWVRDILLPVVAFASSAAWAVRASARSVVQRLRGARLRPPRGGAAPRVLIALFGASELDIVEDLCKELRRAGCRDLHTVDLGFELTGRQARQRGWAVGDLLAHTTMRSFLRGLSAPLGGCNVWRRVAQDSVWRNSFATSAASLWRAAAPRAAATAIAELTRTILHGTIADELLRRTQPDVVVTFKRGHHVPAGLVLAAQRHRTPTVYVQHGLLSETFRTQPSLPHTRFLVFSEHAREQIAASGVAREAVEVVGHAGYDALARRETEHPEAARLRSLTDGAQRVLLLLTQPDEGLRGLAGGAWIEHALEAATRIDGCRVIVKVHPRDRRASAYAALAAELGGDVRIVPHAEAKLPQLWPLCDAVALGYSTAALEAVIVGKPVVSINLTGADDCYPFAASGAVLAARTPGEILPLLRAALTDEQTRQQLMQRRAEFIERHVGPLDGRAAERMARIILDIARQRTVDESSATPET